MTLPTGTITMAQVNAEISASPTAYITLNDADVRTIADIPSGFISMDDLRGQSYAFQATGGTVYNGPNYVTHVFTSPGTFSVQSTGSSGSVNYVIIGGGGGCGYEVPGGNTAPHPGEWGTGGAGAYRTGSTTVTATDYPVVIGGGGGAYNNGGTSSVFSLSSPGGGGGAPSGSNGKSGGSGGAGGAARASPSFTSSAGSGGNTTDSNYGMYGEPGWPYIVYPDGYRRTGYGGLGGGANWAGNNNAATQSPFSSRNMDQGTYLPSEVGPHTTTSRVAGGGRYDYPTIPAASKDPGYNRYGGGGGLTEGQSGQAGFVAVTYFV